MAVLEVGEKEKFPEKKERKMDKKDEVIVVELRDSEWNRGRAETGDNGLKTTDGYCCLGFDLEACGLEEVPYVRTPKGAYNMTKDIPETYAVWVMGSDAFSTFVRKEDTELTKDAMFINDDPLISDDERFEKLEKIFAQVGRKLVWRKDL